MKAYVMTTGIVFALITVAHIWRGIVEGPRLAMQPWFLLLTIGVAGLCFWSVRLLVRWPRS